MFSIALLCLLPVIAAYNPLRAPCGLSYEEGQAYKTYANRVKPGLIASCNLFGDAQAAVETGYEPNLEDGMKFWVTKSIPYDGTSRFVRVLKKVLEQMPTNVDGRVKTYGCGYSLEYTPSETKFIVGCLFSRKTYYYG
ncbi:hypothetical protein Q1695_008067 [Nippostrongylus brasiliensis]|nr:hypothetical protein Q1695_008067 [Nippostrongylus brasiliensis]